MNAHEARHAKIFVALSEVIFQTYGFIPRAVREDITAQVCAMVITEQAYAEKEWRDLADRANLPADVVGEVVAELQAPIGGAS